MAASVGSLVVGTAEGEPDNARGNKGEVEDAGAGVVGSDLTRVLPLPKVPAAAAVARPPPPVIGTAMVEVFLAEAASSQSSVRLLSMGERRLVVSGEETSGEDTPGEFVMDAGEG